MEGIEHAIKMETVSKIRSRRNTVDSEYSYVSPVMTSRRFSRRPLEAKFGIFMTVKGGITAEFLKTILEGTINGTFMVDLTYPSWYLRFILYSNTRYESMQASCFKERWFLPIILL